MYNNILYCESINLKMISNNSNNSSSNNNNNNNNTPSSSDSDTSRKIPKTAEEKLMVAIRIRPLKQDEPQRCLYAINKKVNYLICYLKYKQYRVIETLIYSSKGLLVELIRNKFIHN